MRWYISAVRESKHVASALFWSSMACSLEARAEASSRFRTRHFVAAMRFLSKIRRRRGSFGRPSESNSLLPREESEASPGVADDDVVAEEEEGTEDDDEDTRL